jgi:hypothetical protein
MRDMFYLERLPKVGKVFQQLHYTAVIGSEEQAKDQNGEELWLSISLLGEAAGIGRQPGLADLESFLSQSDWRLGHGTHSYLPPSMTNTSAVLQKNFRGFQQSKTVTEL